MQTDDEWIAPDKLYHILFCFIVAVASAELVRRFGNSLLRQRCVPVGCIFSMAAGAAKEVGDELGLWVSGGGSVKDAVADFAGIVLAAAVLRASASSSRSKIPPDDTDRFQADASV